LGNATRNRSEAQTRIQTEEISDEEKTHLQAELNNIVQQMELILPRFQTAQAEQQKAKAAWDAAKTQWEAEDKKKEGLLKVNETPQQATLSDLFQGDEIGNYQLIDLAKVQMFFFTAAILVAYGVALAGLLQNPGSLFNPLGVDLPQFSSSLNALLGISHAGYLTVKSVDQTKSEG
jgi:hypothetical protein